MPAELCAPVAVELQALKRLQAQLIGCLEKQDYREGFWELGGDDI